MWSPHLALMSGLVEMEKPNITIDAWVQQDQEEDTTKLQKVVVGEITKGDAEAYAAAARGEGSTTKTKMEENGALESATAQQGETDHPFQV